MPQRTAAHKVQRSTYVKVDGLAHASRPAATSRAGQACGVASRENRY